MNAVVRPEAFLEEAEHAEFVKLSGADKFYKMQNVESLAPALSEMGRARMADTFDVIAAKFTAAALRLRRYRVDKDIPEFLREGTTVPLRTGGSS